jgi:hypothetical protein
MSVLNVTALGSSCAASICVRGTPRAVVSGHAHTHCWVCRGTARHALRRHQLAQRSSPLSLSLTAKGQWACSNALLGVPRHGPACVETPPAGATQLLSLSLSLTAEGQWACSHALLGVPRHTVQPCVETPPTSCRNAAPFAPCAATPRQEWVGDLRARSRNRSALVGLVVALHPFSHSTLSLSSTGGMG